MHGDLRGGSWLVRVGGTTTLTGEFLEGESRLHCDGHCKGFHRPGRSVILHFESLASLFPLLLVHEIVTQHIIQASTEGPVRGTLNRQSSQTNLVCGVSNQLFIERVDKT